MRASRVTPFLLAAALVCAAGCGRTAREAPDRHVALAGQPNFRDVGGYETRDGRRVRWGQVYRSGELPDLTDADVERLAELGIRTDVNFLVPEEIQGHGSDQLPSGTAEVSLPIGGSVGELALVVHEAIRSGDFSALTPDLTPKAHGALLHDGREQYATFLRTVLDPDKRPLVFHCSHGIHRMGTAAALLLSALGVPWATIREDYLLSNRYRQAESRAALERIREVLAAKAGVPPGDVDMTNAEAFFILEDHYIDGVLDEAVKQWGSMDAHLRDGLGITDDELERLRAELLERGEHDAE